MRIYLLSESNLRQPLCSQSEYPTEMEDSHHQFPEDWRIRPPSIEEIPSGACVIQCDASYKNGITGISTIIKTQGKQYEPIEYSSRSKGPIHAELTSISKAIKRLSLLKLPNNTTSVLIYTDCLYAFNFIEEIWVAKCDYIKEALSEIEVAMLPLGDNIDIVILHTNTKHNRRLDRRAKRKRESIESAKRKQIADRIERVETAIVRSREIMILENGNDYRALPRENGFPPGYLVTLDPPGCQCPWWKHKWAEKGEIIIRARALPCKHICALSEYLKEDIYDLFSKQIGRMD